MSKASPTTPRKRGKFDSAKQSAERKLNFSELLELSNTQSARTLKAQSGSGERSRSAERTLRQATYRRDSYLGPEAQKEAAILIREEDAPEPPLERIKAEKEYRRAQQMA